MSDSTITNLQVGKAEQVVEAKVYREWISKSLSDMTDQAFCCILIDIEGNGIQANMSLNDHTYFDNCLKLQMVYRISGFICEYTKPYQQTLANRISLKFGKMASFIHLPGKENDFPNHHFEFISHNQLPSRIPYRNQTTGKMVYPILTDYLGCIRSISDIVAYGDANTGQKYRRKVEIENLDDSIVEFTMWDNLAHEFDKTEIEKRSFPRILAVSSRKVRRYRDLLQLTATSATHFYVNPRIREATEAYTMFKEKYSLNPPLQIVRYPYTDPELEKLRNRQTLASLLQQNPAIFKGIRFTCEATLTSINKYKPWNYASCEKCSKSSTLQDETYYCADHGKQEPVTYRYKFKATATDGTATAEFTFFTVAGEKLTTKPCGILKASSHTLQEHQLPVQITNEIGKTHIFQIQYEESSQKGSGRFVVNDILDIPTPSTDTVAGVSTNICSSSSNQLVEDVYLLTQIASQAEDAATPICEITGTPSERVNEKSGATPKIIQARQQPTKRSLDKEFSATCKKPKSD